jgi:hypothetical protein
MTASEDQFDLDLAALLDPGSQPEAPAAFRLAVIERVYARRQSKGARRRAAVWVLSFAAVGMTAQVAGPAIERVMIEPAFLAGALAMTAALAAVVIAQGPQRAFAWLSPRL